MKTKDVYMKCKSGCKEWALHKVDLRPQRVPNSKYDGWLFCTCTNCQTSNFHSPEFIAKHESQVMKSYTKVMQIEKENQWQKKAKNCCSTELVCLGVMLGIISCMLAWMVII